MQSGGFCPLICPTEECPTAVAADASIVRVVGLPWRSLLPADGTQSIVPNFFDIRIDNLIGI